VRIRAWSVVFSLLLVASGAFGFYSIRTTMRHRQLGGQSKFVSQLSIPKTQSLKEIINKSQKLVVQLEVEDMWETSVGSGFLYNNQGDIITNAHVVGDASRVKVKMANKVTYWGTVIGKSSQLDIALVRVGELVEVEPLKLARSYKADVGDEVIAIGSPLGFQNTATTGIISGIGRSMNLGNYHYRGAYQISAPITYGNSGGPLISCSTGEVVGVNFGGTELGTIGFAIPISQVLPLVENWSRYPQRSLSQSQAQSDEVWEYEAEDLVSYLYYCLDAGDYLTAYSLWNNAWKKSTSYEKYRGGYLDTISVEITEIDSEKIEPHLVKVFLEIEAQERLETGERTSRYRGSYNVGRENGELRLLTGQLKKTY
jgi:serine protease Do